MPASGEPGGPAPGEPTDTVDSYLEPAGPEAVVAAEGAPERRRRVRAIERNAVTSDSAWLAVMECLLAQRPLFTALWPLRTPVELLRSPPSEDEFRARCEETIRALDAISRGDLLRREQAQAAHGMLQRSLEALRAPGRSAYAGAVQEYQRIQDEVLRVLSGRVASHPREASAVLSVGAVEPTGKRLRSVAELLRAVAQAEAGAVLELSAGGFVLTQGLEIPRSMTLRGAGRELTRVVCEAEGFVVGLACEGVFTAEDISFEHRGGRTARVAMIDKGEAVFVACSFSGGALDPEGHRGGTGIEFQGSARGRVEGCIIEGNAGSGIRVLGTSTPTLKNNVLRANLGDGIFYFDAAGGVARGNICEGNREGISVGAQATPTLEGNVLRLNQGAGIAYFETAGGVARSNTSSENKVHGISVEGKATPTLEGNVLRLNQGAGIAYFESAGGAARANSAESNRQGISAGGESTPTLDHNVLSKNLGSGIAYFERASGAARSNLCEGNGSHGLAVQGDAFPRLDGNTLRANAGHGIGYFERAGGSARANLCEGNKLNGIGLGGEALTTLESNTLRANEGVALGYFEASGGLARSNVIVGEGSRDVVYVKRTASPTLQGNTGRVLRQKPL